MKGWGPIWHNWKVRDQFNTKTKSWGPKQYLNLKFIIYILVLDIYYDYFCIYGTICSFYQRKYNCQDSNGIFNYKKLKV